MRRIGWLVLGLVTVAACSHGPSTATQARHTPTTPTTAPPDTTRGHVTAHLEVATHVVAAGATFRVVLIIENGTGKPIIQPLCNDPSRWQAFLANGAAASGPLAVPSVARRCQQHNVPTGETRLAFTVNATYSECAPGADSSPPTPKCLPGNRMPSLPVGQYRLDTNAAPYLGVPKAVPLNMRVVGQTR
jgi:hypothetical protein